MVPIYFWTSNKQGSSKFFVPQLCLLYVFCISMTNQKVPCGGGKRNELPIPFFHLLPLTKYLILPHTLSYLLLCTGLYRPQNMPNMSTNHTVTISECIYLPSRSIHLQKSVFWRILSEFRIEINHSKDNRIIDKDHHIGTVISALVPDP